MNDNFRTTTAAQIAELVRDQQCDLLTAVRLITTYGEMEAIKGQMQFAKTLDRIMQPLRGAKS